MKRLYITVLAVLALITGMAIANTRWNELPEGLINLRVEILQENILMRVHGHQDEPECYLWQRINAVGNGIFYHIDCPKEA